MHISILAVGRLKEKYWVSGQQEYLKRLQAYAKCEVKEVSDEPCSQNMSDKESKLVKDKEGLKLERLINPACFLISLDRCGKMFDSEELAEYFNKLALTGKSNITFVIGGSLGLSKNLLDKSDLLLSFSKFTFPHQLMRIILLEQIFRAFKIIKGEPYHK